MSRFVCSCLGGVLCLGVLLLTSLGAQAQSTLSNIDDTSRLNWQHCTAPSCAGGNGNSIAGVANITESAPFNFTVDGSSLRFDLAMNGCTSNCYSNALFWNQLASYGVPNSGTDAATNISMSMDVGMDSPGINNSQALEFTVNQTFCTSGACPSGTYTRFVYSFQCDFQSGVWRIWDGSTHSWVSTGAGCVRFSVTNPNGPSFNHFIFNFTRPDLGHVHYVDFYVNNTHVVVNQTLTPENLGSTQAHEFNASMQLDGNFSGVPYSAWIDQWSITYQ